MKLLHARYRYAPGHEAAAGTMKDASRSRASERRLVLGLVAACAVAGCRRGESPRPTAEGAPPAAASSAPAVASASSAAASAAAPAPPSRSAPGARPLTEKEKQAIAAYKAALARGRLATRERRYHAAIQAFNDALALDPTDARALAELGFAHLSDGNSHAAEGNFTAALAGAGDPELRSQIWFNLGLLRDKAGDPEAARVAYANAHALRPSAATRGKLAGRSMCAVEVRKAGVEGAVVVPSWIELLALVGPGEEEPGPAREVTSEAAARARLCGLEGKGASHGPCAGDPPWIFPREYGTYTYFHNHVVFPRKPAGFVVPDGGHSGGWPARCQGIRSVSGSTEGALLVVDAFFSGAGAVFDGEANEEQRCRDGVSHHERTFYDARTGRAIVALRWPEGSAVDVKVEGGHVVVSGAECNERFQLDAHVR
ncbi:tetratricopeptide repeat protein [Sorangium sp. So ce233]|uniref:tetratricopeptide repeat protein n=1 Tax=Sorangium sp. So ce233 TaxID=3133290 RepID=UPI003F622E78